jgi:L-fuconolactonase
MVTEIGPDWQLDDLRAHADTVIDCFSPERVMFGSDWPVLNLAGDYLGWLNAVRTLIGNLSESEQEAILSRTAIRFYDLAV